MNDTVREYLNETVLENDLFGDIVNISTHERQIESLEKYFIISEFIEIISNVVNISAYIFLAVTICRFKRLKSRNNIFLLHLAILYVIYNIAKVILNTLTVNIEYDLVLEQGSTSVVFLYLTIAFTLGLDWFLSGYKPHWLEKYGRYYKHFLVVLYGIALTEYLLTFVYTHMHHMIRMGISKLFFSVLIVSMIVINILKRYVTLKSNSVKTEYAFNVSNVIIFALFPLFLWDSLIHTSLIQNYTFVCIAIIPEILWYNHPIVVVYLLGVQNKHFKTAYKKSFKRSVQYYSDEDFVEDSERPIGEDQNHVESTSNHVQQNNLRQTSIV